MAPKPFVYQVTMPDDIQFNHEIIVDLTWIEERPHRPALHIVNRGMHFSAAQFVSGEDSESVRNAFIACWVSIYIGFPNVLKHDYGSCFTSKFFQRTCSNFGMVCKEIPCESHNCLGPGERYHSPLCTIHNKI